LFAATNLVVSGAAWALEPNPQPAENHRQAQPTLPISEFSIGLHVIKAEVANNAQTRQMGLMFRTKLASNHGMLFVFETIATQCMWMRHTLIPLSVAFIDEGGYIVNIEDMSPRTDTRHCSSKPVNHALEMPQGWFARRGLTPGAQLKRLSQ